MKPCLALAPVVALLSLLPALPARAHPHVTVTVKTEVVVDEKGTVTALRHAWTFDEAFSAFSTQGLDTNKDGKLSREELAELAKINVESLSEYGYFSELKVGKSKVGFGEVTDFHLSHDGKALTLHYTLPVKDNAPDLRAAQLEVYDPSYFVAFGFDAGTPVTVAGALACKATVNRPRGEVFSRLSKLSEAEFESGKLGASEWTSPVTFSCP